MAQPIEVEVLTPRGKSIPVRKPVLPYAIGAFLVVLAGIFAIGAGIYVSNDTGPLWALILVGWHVATVRDSRKKTSPWEPAVLGLLMGLCTALIGGAVLYTEHIGALWALALVGFADEII